MVPEEGLEPSSREAHDFESCAYTNSATPACLVEEQRQLYYITSVWYTAI